MPKVSDRYLAAKRDQIIDAAIVCFARSGFEATTIEDICREAGVSHGSVYRYFESKEDIIIATLRREHEIREARYSKVFHDTDARRLLESYFDIYFRRRMEPEAETTMKFRIQLFGEMVRNPHIGEIQRINDDKLTQSAIEAILSAQKRGEINPCLDAAAAIRIVRAFADGFYVQRSISPELDVEASMEAARIIFNTGIFGRTNGGGGTKWL